MKRREETMTAARQAVGKEEVAASRLTCSPRRFAKEDCL